MKHTFKPKRYWARGAFPRLDEAKAAARCFCGNPRKEPHPFCKPCTERLPSELRRDRTIATLAACEQWLRMNPR